MSEGFQQYSNLKPQPLPSIKDSNTHTENKAGTRYKREIPTKQSNKDSTSLSFASQSRMSRKKFLGDLVASKILDSQKVIRASQADPSELKPIQSYLRDFEFKKNPAKTA